jgi:hypothetical protein
MLTCAESLACVWIRSTTSLSHVSLIFRKYHECELYNYNRRLLECGYSSHRFVGEQEAPRAPFHLRCFQRHSGKERFCWRCAWMRRLRAMLVCTHLLATANCATWSNRVHPNALSPERIGTSVGLDIFKPSSICPLCPLIERFKPRWRAFPSRCCTSAAPRVQGSQQAISNSNKITKECNTGRRNAKEKLKTCNSFLKTFFFRFLAAKRSFTFILNLIEIFVFSRASLKISRLNHHSALSSCRLLFSTLQARMIS